MTKRPQTPLRARTTGLAPHVRPGQRRLPARTAGALEEIGYDPEPSMKLSRAIFIVIIMHVIAVGGMYLFQHLRDSRLARTESSVSQQTTPAVDSPVARPAEGIRMHYVEAGQSLSAIARIYSVTVEDLAAENGIVNPGEIQVGQELRIPVGRLEQAQPLDVDALTSAPVGTRLDEEEVLASAPANRVPVAEPTQTAPERTAVAKPTPKPVVAPSRAGEPETGPDPVELSLREQFLRARRGEAGGPAVRRAEAASAAPVAPSRSNGARTHVVQKGDNPVSIARKYDVSYSALLELNNISDPRKLQIGQTLKIPASAN